MVFIMSEEAVNKASAPKADNEGVYHLRLKQGDVPGYVILPGAPERALKIAKNWENPKEIASYREYKTVTGTYKGMQLAATSTGIGGPSSEICIHELNTLGVHTCIRVGTTGCIVPQFDLGDLIIPVACYRKDGTSATYIEPEFPSFANPYVTMALIQACENLGFRYGIGLDYTVGSFYIGQGRPLYEDGRKSYWPSFAEKILPDLEIRGVVLIYPSRAGEVTTADHNGTAVTPMTPAQFVREIGRWFADDPATVDRDAFTTVVEQVVSAGR